RRHIEARAAAAPQRPRVVAHRACDPSRIVASSGRDEGGADTMRRTTRRCLTMVLWLAIAGCAAVRREEVKQTENLLAAAGFQAKPADTPARVAKLASMPKEKLVARSKSGAYVYTYADPDDCHCLYVGGAKEYAEYRRLALQQQVSEEQL